MLMTKAMMTTKLVIWLLLRFKPIIFESIKASRFLDVDNDECGSEPLNVTIKASEMLVAPRISEYFLKF